VDPIISAIGAIMMDGREDAGGVMAPAAAALVCATALVGASACGRRSASSASARAVHRSLTTNVLSTGHASEWSRNTMNGWGSSIATSRIRSRLAELRAIVASDRGGPASSSRCRALVPLRGQVGEETALLAAACTRMRFCCRNASKTRRARSIRERVLPRPLQSCDHGGFKGRTGNVELAREDIAAFVRSSDDRSRVL